MLVEKDKFLDHV